MTISDLKKGEHAIIHSYDVNSIPLKLIEMGCLVGNTVSLVQKAPLNDPLYLNINGTFLAIRKEVAIQIEIDKI